MKSPSTLSDLFLGLFKGESSAPSGLNPQLFATGPDGIRNPHRRAGGGQPHRRAEERPGPDQAGLGKQRRPESVDHRL